LSITPDVVHHPANIREASFTCGVLDGTVAPVGLFLLLNPLKDGGSAMLQKIILNVFSGIAETIADSF
jgi:hypothetical protein